MSVLPHLLETVHVGKKYRGYPWAAVPPDYLRWLLKQPWFSDKLEHFTALHFLDLTAAAER
jgi:hypothetical protein